jgi:hypothetical protein
MAPIREADNLVKTSGEHVAVGGVRFSVEEGEVFGLPSCCVRSVARGYRGRGPGTKPSVPPSLCAIDS